MSDKRQQPKPQQPSVLMLSNEQMEAVVDHINRIVGGPDKDACPVCGSCENSVEPYVFQVPVLYEPAGIGIGRYAPNYATNCKKCGYTRFFNKNVVDSLIMKASERGDP